MLIYIYHIKSPQEIEAAILDILSSIPTTIRKSPIRMSTIRGVSFQATEDQHNNNNTSPSLLMLKQVDDDNYNNNLVMKTSEVMIDKSTSLINRFDNNELSVPIVTEKVVKFGRRSTFFQ